ncbi:hypothetical protein Tco_1459260 [Tanacetum coccineum]
MIGLECNRSLPKGVPFVNHMVIEELEYGIFFIDVFGDQAFQRWYDIHKVGVDSLVSYLVMSLMVKTEENVRFSLKLRKMIADHLDQDKLKSKKLKLEALGYHTQCKKKLYIFTHTDKHLGTHSVSCLQDAQPEFTRKTLVFSEAVLSE